MCELYDHCIISTIAFCGDEEALDDVLKCLGGASQLPGDTCLEHMLLGGGGGGGGPTITPSCYAAYWLRHAPTHLCPRRKTKNKKTRLKD